MIYVTPFKLNCMLTSKCKTTVQGRVSQERQLLHCHRKAERAAAVTLKKQHRMAYNTCYHGSGHRYIQYKATEPKMHPKPEKSAEPQFSWGYCPARHGNIEQHWGPPASHPELEFHFFGQACRKALDNDKKSLIVGYHL